MNIKLPNYVNAKEKLNTSENHEAAQLCKQLLETAEACEVGAKHNYEYLILICSQIELECLL